MRILTRAEEIALISQAIEAHEPNETTEDVAARIIEALRLSQPDSNLVGFVLRQARERVHAHILNTEPITTGAGILDAITAVQ